MPRLIPGIVWSMPRQAKEIYLTFDDGPHPEITPWVMQQLDIYNAKATFFCVGDNVRKYPGIFESLLAKGHRIGNHTYNHLDGWKTETAAYLDNIKQCDDLTQTELFRPPYGKITVAQYREAKKKYKLIYWSILSRDFEVGLDTDESLEYMLANSGNGSIVLFHDSVKAEKNMKIMLPVFLKHFAEAGFAFKVL